MSTYYGYAERDDDSQIDWSVIGKDINKKLKAEVDRRDKLKADIEEKSREYQTTLDNVPIGADESATKNAIAYTTDAAEYKLGLTKALKFGDMNVKKYLQATNSLRIDTEGAFVMYKNYQKYNDQKIARMDSNDPKTRGNVLETALYKHTGGYMNMRNSRAFIDPNTGRVLFARMDKDGNRLIGEEGKYPPISIPMMNNYITSEIASFDVDKAVDDTSKSIGTSTITVERYLEKGGGLQAQQITITDKTQALIEDLYNKGLIATDPAELKTYISKYNEAKKAKVDFYMGNDNNVVDYLVRMGIGYEPTFDEDEFKEDGKMILVKQDPDTDGYELVFPKDAKKDAKEALSAAIDAKQASLVQTKTTSLYKAPKLPKTPEEKTSDIKLKANNAIDNAKQVALWDIVYGEDDVRQKGLSALKNYANKAQGVLGFSAKTINPGTKNQKENLYYTVYNKDTKKNEDILWVEDFDKLPPKALLDKLVLTNKVTILTTEGKGVTTIDDVSKGYDDKELLKSYGLTKPETRRKTGGAYLTSEEDVFKYTAAKKRRTANADGIKATPGKTFAAIYGGGTTIGNSTDFVDAWGSSFMAQGDEPSMDAIPMNSRNFDIIAVDSANSKAIHDDSTGMSGNSQVVEIRLPPEIGPSFVLPLSNSYMSKEQMANLGNWLDDKIIQQEKLREKYKPFTLKDVKDFINEYKPEVIYGVGTPSKAYFDNFQTGYQKRLKENVPYLQGELPNKNRKYTTPPAPVVEEGELD